jgi:hypothetical protein
MADTCSITRRTFFRGAPLAALPLSYPTGVSDELLAAIARHQHADDMFSANCWRSDELDPRYASDTPENNERIFCAALKAEAETLDALLALPVDTREDMAAKARHLLAYLHRNGLETRHFDRLLRAMIA